MSITLQGHIQGIDTFTWSETPWHFDPTQTVYYTHFNGFSLDSSYEISLMPHCTLSNQNNGIKENEINNPLLVHQISTEFLRIKRNQLNQSERN